MKISLDYIYPLIVPANYFEKGTWELPHHTLPNHSFILTWVIIGSASSMYYLTQEQYQALNNHHDGWQQKSLENLRSSIGDDETFISRFKMTEDGQLHWLCFMNGDGIGSSRILLSNELSKAFPLGYYLAFPDRSCGLVIAKNINDNDLQEIKDMIKGIYKNATTAMSEKLHLASEFLLPENWTKPLDTELSDILVNDIFNLGTAP